MGGTIKGPFDPSNLHEETGPGAGAARVRPVREFLAKRLWVASCPSCCQNRMAPTMLDDCVSNIAPTPSSRATELGDVRYRAVAVR